MSVDKLSDDTRVRSQQVPFTQISNEVIVHIKDNDAFRAYCYLQSKSQTWKVVKDHLRNVCGIGMRKLDYVFSYLKRANLVRYITVVDNMNKFVRVEIHVLNGLDFDKDEPFDKNKSNKSDLSTETVKKSTYPQSTPAETAAAETAAAETAGGLYEIKTLRNKEKQNRLLPDQKQNKAAPRSAVNSQPIHQSVRPTEEQKQRMSEQTQRNAVQVRDIMNKFGLTRNNNDSSELEASG